MAAKFREPGQPFTAQQQGALYRARKRRVARANAAPSQFKPKIKNLGVAVKVTLTVQ
jgi:hypothetical protein